MAPAARAEPITACHVLAVPYPGRGHVNPMMNLCKLLTNSRPHLVITFVVTEEWLGFIGSEEKPPSIRFATIPNVLPSELARAADMPSFVGATQTKMEEPFELLVDLLDAPVNFIIADTFLQWAVDFGNRRNIPVASLWPMPASVFSIFYHFDLLVRNGHHPFELTERGEERVDYIPGVSSIRLADIPSIAHMKDQRLLQLALRIFPSVPKAQYLLCSSIFELEPQVIEALKQEFSFPIYTFGPAIPYFNLENVTAFTTNQNDHHHYFEWLKSQPPSSVLYVSLGSFLSVSSAQMDEIADGLRESGVRFLWVARGEATRLQEKCGDLGRVVPWCEQLKVLCHSSVGGFWTHCGWNSTMEGIFAGVPMIAFPIIMDQTTIRKHIVEDWKIGWDAKRGVGAGNLLRSGEIAKLVKKFMDLENAERKEITTRAKELQKATRQAISDGGSSIMNLNSFLDDIMSFS
ncbi:UDP-glucuronosyl and UDP-glucosyl transferase [Handroanthus impetiginosus]|uniref:UDP-glucuronosyl and UDP-glucosyl transferase n=1 Tax=Handroanthus impetiginosus TaxID=429701 RepID=A0A2G9I8W6_9LAMI|nr:UDP-glucuronosyl and UDP-glucosyl transferase [Handroanthus impetiginosus]